jgi:hypothetical protein
LHLQAEGKAVNGEYNITGTITSSVLLRLFLRKKEVQHHLLLMIQQQK